jgi:hypothetical protein
MPNNQTATHPKTGWSITFTESDHSYIDDQGSRYASGTGLVSVFFPQFDTRYHATRIAAREKRAVESVIAQWEAKAKEAGDYGTTVHGYAESLILGRSSTKPATEKERVAFSAVDRALVGIRQHYDIIGCEQIIFAPCLHLAGTIDLPVRRKIDGRYGILDWKTNEAIDLTPRFNQTALPPIQHIPDCNGNHYRLQFAIYAQIMRIGQYVDLDEPFDNGIIYIPPMSPNPAWIPMADAKPEADAMIRCWESAYFNQELSAPELLEKTRKAA